MAAIALAEALPDFGGSRKVAGPAADPLQLFPATPPAASGSRDAPKQEQEGPTVEERIAAEREALRLELEQAHGAALDALHAEHAAEMAALEARSGAELGALVAAAMAEAEQRLIETTANSAARILGVALTGKLEERGVEALVQAIRAAVADTDAVRIVVRGAPHLFEAVSAELGLRADHLEFHESDALDLSVSIDDKVFETRIAEWSAALSEVLA